MLEEHSVNVSLKMVDRDQWFAERKRERLSKADTYQQGACQTRTLRNGNRVNRFVSLPSLSEGLPDNGDNRPQMFARRQLRNDSSIGSMGGDLGRNDVR